MNADLLLTIIITPKLSEYSDVDDEIVGTVFESYKEYKKMKAADDADEKLLINHEKAELY